MTAHTYALFIVALFAASCASCGDDTNNGTPTECPENQVFNPVQGSCQPQFAMNNPNNSMSDAGTDDTGSDNNENNSNNSNNDVDMGGGSTDMGGSCTGNDRRCVGNVVERCVDGMFEMAQTCGQGLICERGNCVPEDAGTCEPGDRRCTSATTYTTCLADGETFGDEAMCGEGESCMGGECTAGCAGLINEKSNVGCEYFTMRHEQATGSAGAVSHSVVVSNPGEQDVTIEVTSPGGLDPMIAQQTIAPLDSAVLDFPVSPAVDTRGLSQNIYLIRSSRPVIATQFSPLNNPGAGRETSDASLLLPTNAAGQEYVVVGWRSLQPNGTWIDIVALEANTSVSVESPTDLSGGNAGSVSANSTGNFTIPMAGQVLHLEDNGGGDTELSGVVINADKPVAVFTGATIVNIPDDRIRENPPNGCTGSFDPPFPFIQPSGQFACTSNSECCSGTCAFFPGTNSYECRDGLQAGDHIEQQLFPVDSWGTSYVATPFYSRGTDDFSIYRVVAANDGTNITLDPPVNGVTMLTLNRGEWEQFYGPDAFELTADQPVMVGQFMVGGQVSSSEDGDPASMLPPAVQQYRDSYVFLVPGNYARNYVTLVKEPGTAIMLDGTAVAQAEFQPVGTAGNWEYAIIDTVNAGVHRATSTEPFGVVVHGMDYYISYAFAGGIILPE